MDAPTVAAVASSVAAVAASLSAIAAAVSARSSRQSVTRAHAPYVWPALRIGEQHMGLFAFHVRLHNDGPGVAFNVRFSIRTREHEHGYVIPSIRAMRSGEVIPPHPEPQEQPMHERRDGVEEYRVAGPADLSEPAWVVVRFADGLGRSWEVESPVDPHAWPTPRRLRSRRFEIWRRAERW